jgi:hypothetical protein
MHIAYILKEKLDYLKTHPDTALTKFGSDYNKEWARGVNFFLIEINKDRANEKKPLTTFMAVRQKLLALKEISDLRWFYYVCKKYSRTFDKEGDKNTFSKCFWGALK